MATPIRNILVVGAAGKLGSAIVAEARRRGLNVTAYVRSKAKAASLPKGVTIAEGDGRDSAALERAMTGIDAVVIPAGGRTEPVTGKVVGAALPAMQKRGIQRVIVASAYGAVDGRGFYSWVMRTAAGKVVADKVEAEQLLRASPLEWTAVRPGILTDGPATGAVKAADGAVLRGFPRISRADVAAFIVDELQKPRFVRASPVVSV